MSTITSSAVGGSKAKPKAPPRRRAGGVATPLPETSQPTTQSEEQIDTPAVQEKVTSEREAGHDTQPTLAPPSPPAVVERPVHLDAEQEESSAAPGALLEEVPGYAVAQDDSRAVNTEETSRLPAAATSQVEQVPVIATTTNNPPKATRKRAREVKERDVSAPAANKRTKRSSVRSSIVVQAAVAQTPPEVVQTTSTQPVEDPATTPGVVTRGARTRQAAQRKSNQIEAVQPAPSRGRKKAKLNETKTSQTVPSTAQDTDEPNGETNSAIQPSKTAKAKRKHNVKKSAPTIDAEDEEAPLADEAAQEEPQEAVDDDEDPEERKIDPATLSMYDLTHGMKFGRVSEREKKMALIDWAAVKQKRVEEADAIARGDFSKSKDTNVVQSTEASGEAPPDELEDDDDTRVQANTRTSGNGLRFRLVNGTIVEDTESLTIDRAARVVDAAAQDEDVPVEEENDLTRRLNRSTWINARKRDETERVPLWRSKSSAWNEEETDRFYDALRMFGTDFFVISQLFEGRTRRMIKLKFVREERLEPDRINAALLGQRTSTIDLEQYAQAIGKDINDFNKYDSLEHANEVIRESMKDKEDAMRAAVKEDEENNRQREHQRQQREKQRLEAEKKKEERARKKNARRRGDVWGAGTLAGTDDDAMDGDD